MLESDKETLKDLKRSFDFLLDTIPQKHDIDPFVTLLKRDKTLAIVGALEPLKAVNNQERAMHRTSVAGSIIGGIAETQEVLDFCAQHGIGLDIQVIPIQPDQRGLQGRDRRRRALSLRDRPGLAQGRRGRLTAIPGVRMLRGGCRPPGAVGPICSEVAYLIPRRRGWKAEMEGLTASVSGCLRLSPLRSGFRLRQDDKEERRGAVMA